MSSWVVHLVFSLLVVPRSVAITRLYDFGLKGSEIIGSVAADVAAHHALQSFLVAKDNTVLFEKHYSQPSEGKWAVLHDNLPGQESPHFLMSMTKCLTSVAVGRAIQLGYLDQDLNKPIVDYLKVDRTKIAKGADKITVDNLLSMRSGLKPTLSAVGVLQASAEELLTETPPVTPGVTYSYQDSDPSLLWMILDTVSPKGHKHFLDQEVFGPLKITNYNWELSPAGFPKGGAGASVRARDLLTIGMMLINDGRNGATQFLPAEYAKIATTTEYVEGDDGTNYEHLFHHGKPVQGIHFSYGAGAGGQYMVLVPDRNLVVVTTAADDDYNDILQKITNDLIGRL